MAWGNTYETTVNPLFILQKRAVRLITFSNFIKHSNPLFIRLNIIKFCDIVKFQTAIFMYDYHHGNLPEVFDTFFSRVNRRHNGSGVLAGKSYTIFHIMDNSYTIFTSYTIFQKTYTIFQHRFKERTRFLQQRTRSF